MGAFRLGDSAILRVGFTGTRKGLSIAQYEQLKLVFEMFSLYAWELHVGGADGADEQAMRVATIWLRPARIIVHPCPGVVTQDWTRDFVWKEVFPPLVRDRHIARDSHLLVAGPLQDTEIQRSGTWATIRYAREQAIPVVMLTRGRR